MEYERNTRERNAREIRDRYERIGSYYEILRKIAGDGWNPRRSDRSSCFKQEVGTICLKYNPSQASEKEI